MATFREFFSRFKIDWTNQIISFIATILGILIALNLQDWQESRKEQEQIKIAIGSLKGELAANLSNLKWGTGKLDYFNGYVDAIIAYETSDSTLVCSVEIFDSLKRKYPGTFSDANLKSRIGKDKVELRYQVSIDFIPPQLSSDRWEAVKSSGLLSKFNQEDLARFTRVYGWISRDFTGVSADNFLQYINEVGESNIDKKKLVKLTRRLVVSYGIKLSVLEPGYKEIMTK